MSVKSSSGQILIQHAVAPGRTIVKFPQAFHPDGTPHTKINFHVRTKAACQENQTGTVGMRICKAVIVGDVAVGKTSLVNRFCRNIFDRDYKATIGVDFEVEKFSILSVPFTLQIWDTAGQERFKCIAASYYRGANVILVAFDLTDIQSLQHSYQWLHDATVNASSPIVFLVGTKLDLLSDAAYDDIEVKALQVANDIGAEYWPISSKTGVNVREFFLRVAALSFEEAVLHELDAKSSSPQLSIGNNLIGVGHAGDVFDKRRKDGSTKCCN